MEQTRYRRVRELFYEATKLPSSQWDSFLEANSNGDDDLVQAVRRLLDHHDSETLITRIPEKLPRDSELTRHLDPVSRTQVSSDTLRNSEQAQTKRTASVSSITVAARHLTNSLTNQHYRVWLTAIAMVLILSLAALFVDRSLHQLVARNTNNLLKQLIEHQTEAIDMWLDAEFRFAESWARSSEIIEQVELIDAAVRGKQMTASEVSALGDSLRESIARLAGEKISVRYAVWNREYRQVAATKVDLPALGNGTTDFGTQVLSRIFQGKSMLWLQSSKGYFTQGYVPDNVQARPDVAMLLPIYRSNDSMPIAALLLSGFGMQDGFQGIMDKTRFADSAETYAIDSDGFLITESRFVEHLHAVGLLAADKPYSARALRIADPGVNTYHSSLLDTDPLSWPYTLSSRTAIRGGKGSNIEGYADYRGVTVVGAWNWLEKYDFGIITEIDYDKAFEAMVPMRQTYGALLGLLGLVGIVGLAMNVAKERARLRANVEKEIGPYSIDRQIGEGGLAFVYLAQHSLLKRPTAIKQLKPEHLSTQNLLRFEREVQLASNLKHPNTIEIYDYGRTPKGNFYCAMEYVDGITLQTMLDIDGPQPPERVTAILIEICRSLREAHNAGLIHRDIKPQNIMICCRAGEYDCVKVLDFGLARELDNEASRATDTRVLVGTPMYIAPERIMDPTCIDPRSDIFSLGVLAHVLLVGREPYSGVDAMSILSRTLSLPPVHPSEATSEPIPKTLDDAVYRCQARSPSDRFQTVQEVLIALSGVDFVTQWTQERAKVWWKLLEMKAIR